MSALARRAPLPAPGGICPSCGWRGTLSSKVDRRYALRVDIATPAAAVPTRSSNSQISHRHQSTTSHNGPASAPSRSLLSQVSVVVEEQTSFCAGNADLTQLRRHNTTHVPHQFSTGAPASHREVCICSLTYQKPVIQTSHRCAACRPMSVSAVGVSLEPCDQCVKSHAQHAHCA
jgi:hypothetical protein